MKRYLRTERTQRNNIVTRDCQLKTVPSFMQECEAVKFILRELTGCVRAEEGNNLQRGERGRASPWFSPDGENPPFAKRRETNAASPHLQGLARPHVKSSSCVKLKEPLRKLQGALLFTPKAYGCNPRGRKRANICKNPPILDVSGDFR